MSDIVIGFGGTGAKIVQAFLMMGASSALKLHRPVKVLLIDQDKSNGNTVRTIETLETYQKVAALTVRSGNGMPGPLGTAFEAYSGIVWQPLSRLNQALGPYFEYDPNSPTRDLNSQLMEILYDRPQISAPLDEGFLGNPNMGAPVFAETIDFSEQPWKRLDEDMGKGQSEGGTRIVLCGSVFGGTGASGIPNVAKILRQRLQDHHASQSQAKIILNLAMPYFSIRQVEGAAVQATGKDFLPNAKAALQYYDEQKYLDFCDAMYILGEADMAPIEVSKLGGRLQRNCAHPLELFAACNIYDALSTRDAAKLASKIILTNRAEQFKYTWGDLPVEDSNTDFIRARMGAFARCCFAFLCYREGLTNYSQSGAAGMNEWMRYYFPKQQDIHSSDIEAMTTLATLYLEWAGELQLTAHSMPNGYTAEWFDAQPLVHGEASKLDVHLNPITPKSAPNLQRVLLPVRSDERLSERELHSLLLNAHKGRDVPTGLGGFLNTLYASCGNSLKGFNVSNAARGGR